MINKRVLPHYCHLLEVAKVAACSELCEMYLNQARGMLEYALLNLDMTGKEFENEMQRQESIRLNREARRMATGAA